MTQVGTCWIRDTAPMIQAAMNNMCIFQLHARFVKTPPQHTAATKLQQCHLPGLASSRFPPSDNRQATSDASALHLTTVGMCERYHWDNPDWLENIPLSRCTSPPTPCHIFIVPITGT